MLWLLVKKQFIEVFKGYFYDQKKNKKRSTLGTVLYFILYAALMIGVLGGMFSFFALSICADLYLAGMGWLYFVIMSCVAIVLGAFGSVFNTFTGLYLAKDNDLLLSMPIPVKDILASRLINVFILGSMYSVVASIPTMIVYCSVAKVSFATILCNILLIIDIAIFVLILSCILGWCVAKLSQKLKNKSFVTVALSLVFLGAYYFFYFRANELIQDLILNAEKYGEHIKGSAYVLYLFGSIGEGNVITTVIFTAILLGLLALTWIVLERTFIGIATATGNTDKKKYVAKKEKQKSIFLAMLSKEFAKFTSSANYMLNCGIGIIFIIAIGIVFLVKGNEFIDMLTMAFSGSTEFIYLIVCAGLCFTASMNDIIAPSVSLEAKNIWIYQSLPVLPKAVLRAKISLHLLLTGIPVAFASTCAVIVVKPSYVIGLLFYIVPLSFVCFTALWGSLLGIKMPNMTWTNEIYPIKQSAAVTIYVLGNMVISCIFAGLYFLLGMNSPVNITAYLGTFTAIFAGISLLLLRWSDTKGAKLFAEL